MKRVRISSTQIAALWLFTRVAMVILTLIYFEGDCATYFREGRLWIDGHIPYRDYSAEYPPAAIAVFALLALVGSVVRFRFAFIGLALALDAVCMLLLLRKEAAGSRRLAPPLPGDSGGYRPEFAVAAFAFATIPLFPVMFVRFDLMPATACLAGLLLLGRASTPMRTSCAIRVGALLGLAISLKLYPLVLGPLLVLHWRRERLGARAGLIAVGASALVVIASFVPTWVCGSGTRAFDFLRYQSERGIQVESSYAGLLLLLNHLVPFGLVHQMSHSAHDITGPRVDLVTAVAKVLQPLSILWATAVVHRRRIPIVAACGGVLLAAILTGNVFSPQYLIWCIPLAAFAIGGRPNPASIYLMAACGLTGLVFPVLYPRLLQGQFPAIAALVARNAFLVLLMAELVRDRHRRSAPAATASEIGGPSGDLASARAANWDGPPR